MLKFKMTQLDCEKELYEFIQTMTKPTFNGFITRFEDKIAEWSLEVDIFTPQSLHRFWLNRFNSTIRKLRRDLLKTSQFKKDRWNKLFKDLSLLREFKASSRIEGQELESRSMINTSERSLGLLEQESLSRKSSNEAEDVDSDKEEDHADNEDEADSKKEYVEEYPIYQLYKLYYKKFNKHEFHDEEKSLYKR
ncbi:hypothetical protein BDF14DRAFT_1986840 [Spinellus fusiger]|nr:hypothetical protein BDF14DRAFT_1986840 [Spinellus fusiger]